LKPYLNTVLQAVRIPSQTELPPIPEDPGDPGVSCGPR